jgi:hypothetical protein
LKLHLKHYSRNFVCIWLSGYLEALLRYSDQ